MTQILEQLLVKEKFEQWLQSKELSASVGVSRTSCFCPISTYVREKSDCTYVGSSTHSIGIVSEETDGVDYVTPPLWVRKFIYQVDSMREDNVTARAALKVLEGI